jgi:hypothetical protein
MGIAHPTPFYMCDRSQQKNYLKNSILLIFTAISRDFIAGASHFCRNNFLWGGHPARPLALTGKMPVPQENVFAQLGYSLL